MNENLEDSAKFLNLASSLRHFFDKSIKINAAVNMNKSKNNKNLTINDNNQFLNVPHDVNLKKLSPRNHDFQSIESDKLNNDYLFHDNNVKVNTDTIKS